LWQQYYQDKSDAGEKNSISTKGMPFPGIPLSSQ